MFMILHRNKENMIFIFIYIYLIEILLQESVNVGTVYLNKLKRSFFFWTLC